LPRYVAKNNHITESNRLFLECDKYFIVKYNKDRSEASIAHEYYQYNNFPINFNVMLETKGIYKVQLN